MKYLTWLADASRLASATLVGFLFGSHQHSLALVMALLVIVSELALERFTQDHQIYRWIGGYAVVPWLIVVSAIGLSTANVLPVPLSAMLIFILGLPTVYAEMISEPGLRNRLRDPI